MILSSGLTSEFDDFPFVIGLEGCCCSNPISVNKLTDILEVSDIIVSRLKSSE